MKTQRMIGGAVALAVILALLLAGCATKKYVRETVAPVEKHVTDVEKKGAETAAKLDSLAEKTQKDISRVEERAMTADTKAGDAGRSAQQADAKAVQAGQVAQSAQQLGRENQGKIGEVQRAVENIENLKVVSTEEVFFDFGKSALTDEAKGKLDSVAQSVARLSRPQIELEGWADPIGPAEGNLVLSRKRADSVVRHLVEKGIPLRRIHILGQGEVQREGRVTKEERAQMRKVVVRVLAP
jgi:outer membrane protein OmpA-like peptidoglycan-associated protein